MATRALGEGPKGFSLEASLMMLAGSRPCSRATSSMGRPGTYTGRVARDGLNRDSTLLMRCVGSLSRLAHYARRRTRPRAKHPIGAYPHRDTLCGPMSPLGRVRSPSGPALQTWRFRRNRPTTEVLRRGGVCGKTLGCRPMSPLGRVRSRSSPAPQTWRFRRKSAAGA